MFGAYLQLERMARDSAERMAKVRAAYRELETLDSANSLLKLLTLTEDSGRRAPYPDILPIHLTWRFTPEFVKRYEKHQPLTTENVAMEYAEALVRYAEDMELEVRRAKKKAKGIQ